MNKKSVHKPSKPLHSLSQKNNTKHPQQKRKLSTKPTPTTKSSLFQQPSSLSYSLQLRFTPKRTFFWNKEKAQPVPPQQAPSLFNSSSNNSSIDDSLRQRLAEEFQQSHTAEQLQYLGYEPSPELGTEYLDLPPEEMNPKLHANLKSVLGTFDLGLRPYKELVTGEIPKNMAQISANFELKFQRQQLAEDSAKHYAEQQMMLQKNDDYLQREMASMVLRPVRNQIPPHVQHLTNTLVNEARKRNLDEHGNRPTTPEDPTIIPGHSSEVLVPLGNQQIKLSELTDKQLITDIINLNVKWNRSSPHKPTQDPTDLRYSNKAKLEEGVSSFFTANRESEGRAFSYDKLLAKDIQDDSTKNPDNKTPTKFVSVGNPLSEHPQTLASSTHQTPHSETAVDTTADTTEFTPAANNRLPPLPPGITLPTSINLKNLNAIKPMSPFKELSVQRPPLHLNDKLPDNADELSQQLVHHDFLHNSTIRRKPRGKLTELQSRDLLVDLERAHPVDAIMKHYDISMLSLFEETGNSQPLANSSDVIGGFSPLTIRVKTDFDATFIRMIQVLHERSRLRDEKDSENQKILTDQHSHGDHEDKLDGDDFLSPAFRPQSSRVKKKAQLILPGIPTANKKVGKNLDSRAVEKQHLDFVHRLTLTDSDGYTTFHKDDVLIPEIADSVLEILLNETFDRQLHNKDNFEDLSNFKASELNPERGPSSHGQFDESMRSSMIKEMKIFKGKTIKQLHELGCFNRGPYEGDGEAKSSSYDNMADGNGRGRYAFNNEMVHAHRLTSLDQQEWADYQMFGGRHGQEMKTEYSRRVKDKFGDNRFSYRGSPVFQEQGKNPNLYQVDDNGFLIPPISRFAQLALTASVISKYGSLEESYRKATGITMSKIDELIIDALSEGNIHLLQLTEYERQQYLIEIKKEAINFPQLALEAMGDTTHVPYMTTANFGKMPSKFLGVWDYHYATHPGLLREMNLPHTNLTPLGPYHPMFLVTVGGRGFTKENEFGVDQLRSMLGGEIDARPEVKQRRKGAFIKRYGIEPSDSEDDALLNYNPPRSAPANDMEELSFGQPEQFNLQDDSENREPQPLFNRSDDLVRKHHFERSQAKKEKLAQIARLHEENYDQNTLLRQTDPFYSADDLDIDGRYELIQLEASLRAEKEAEQEAIVKHQIDLSSLDDIPEIQDDEDDDQLYQHYKSQADKEQEFLKNQASQSPQQNKASKQLPKLVPQARPPTPLIQPTLESKLSSLSPTPQSIATIGKIDVQDTRPKLPRESPTIPVMDYDPNEIGFNTASMTEFNETLEVNNQDIAKKPFNLLKGGEKTYHMFKAIEQLADIEDDPARKLRLKYFLAHEVENKKAAQMSSDVHGENSGIKMNIQEAQLESVDLELQGSDTAFTQRAKPNPFDGNTTNDKKDPNHELFGGPITVQHFLSAITLTEGGLDIAQEIRKEHKEFLGDSYSKHVFEKKNFSSKTPQNFDPNLPQSTSTKM